MLILFNTIFEVPKQREMKIFRITFCTFDVNRKDIIASSALCFGQLSEGASFFDFNCAHNFNLIQPLLCMQRGVFCFT